MSAPRFQDTTGRASLRPQRRYRAPGMSSPNTFPLRPALKLCRAARRTSRCSWRYLAANPLPGRRNSATGSDAVWQRAFKYADGRPNICAGQAMSAGEIRARSLQTLKSNSPAQPFPIGALRRFISRMFLAASARPGLGRARRRQERLESYAHPRHDATITRSNAVNCDAGSKARVMDTIYARLSAALIQESRGPAVDRPYRAERESVRVTACSTPALTAPKPRRLNRAH